MSKLTTQEVKIREVSSSLIGKDQHAPVAPVSLPPLKGRWKLIKKIGQGAFGRFSWVYVFFCFFTR